MESLVSGCQAEQLGGSLVGFVPALLLGWIFIKHVLIEKNAWIKSDPVVFDETRHFLPLLGAMRREIVDRGCSSDGAAAAVASVESTAQVSFYRLEPAMQGGRPVHH
jgi:hypothetical protein